MEAILLRDIIEAVGYNSYEAFYKAFIAKFGLNPHKYRQANKRQQDIDTYEVYSLADCVGLIEKNACGINE